MRAPMRPELVGLRGAADDLGEIDVAQDSQTIVKNQDVVGIGTTSCDFLRRAFARAILRDDDATAERLRVALDLALNGPPR